MNRFCTERRGLTRAVLARSGCGQMVEGEIFALLGHNGAGKTTTLHMLTGMTAPTSGTAYVYGKNILTEIHQVRQSIGVCPQHDVLWLPLTVEEHLTIFAKLRGIESAEIPATISALLQDVGLTEKRLTAAEELSGGQKRKLSLCSALVGNVTTVSFFFFYLDGYHV